MKIYTGTGDRGTTSLFSGERVSKGHPLVEAYGELDELSSHVGVALAALPAGDDRAAAELRGIQRDLLRAGALLATTAGSPTLAQLERMGADAARGLEAAIDRMGESLPALRGFVLPGGHPSAAAAHVARTVCRRAERQLTRAMGEDPPAHVVDVLLYLNRLSDYLFTLARHCNRRAGVGDEIG